MKKFALLLAFAMGLSVCGAYAADEKAPADKKPADAAKEKDKAKADSKISGKWEGKIEGPEGQEMKLEFTFKVKEDKLTGNVKSQMGELPLEDGKVKGDDFSFNLPIGEMSIEHKGKYADGKIKLTSSSQMGENEMTLTKIVDINGKWKSSFETPDGESMDIVFTFKVDGKKLTGSIESPMGPVDIVNGKIKGDEFSFEVEFGDNSIEHKCKVEGDVIKLKVQGMMGGEDMEQTLKRVPEKAKDEKKDAKKDDKKEEKK